MRVKNVALPPLKKLIGEGSHRRVYEHPEDPKLVVKVLRDDGPYPQKENSNKIEWELWKKVKGTSLEKHFAPCVKLTKDGHLIMQKCKPLTYYLDENMEFLGITIDDSRSPENVGKIGKQVVLFDYGHPSVIKLINKL
jgi:hypothetical protein